jgi:hypothetical protein
MNLATLNVKKNTSKNDVDDFWNDCIINEPSYLATKSNSAENDTQFITCNIIFFIL